MKRLLVILALLLYVCMPASANIVSKPFTFVNGTVIDATKVNPDFDTLYTLVNGNIDSTNISNTLGIYASQILPTTSGQATFGSALGYTFYPNATNQVPLTLIGATGQTADLFDVFLTQAGTKAVWVGSGGVFNTAYAPVFGAPLGIGSGGTGATSAATVAGIGIAVSGTFPNQTVSLSTPVAVANGGTGVTTIPTTTCLGWSGTAFTSPACATGGGSGVTSATSPITFSSGVVACATCAVTNANNNFSVAQSITGTGSTSLTINSGGAGFSDVILNSPTQSSYIDLYNNQAPPASLTQVGNLRAFSSQGQATDIESGVSGGVTANLGSFIAFHTKQDGGADNEALVLTPGAKAYFPGDQYLVRFTTPASCTALVTCGTQTFTFNAPFATTSGAAALPVCTAAGFMDESVPSQMWISDIQSPLASGSVTYNYASTVNLAASHTVDMYITCWAQAY